MLVTIFQLAFDGITIGLVYVILATGLVLIMSVTRIFLVAYGQFYMIGAYSVWYAMYLLNMPYSIALPAGIFSTTLLGILSYFIIFQHLVNKEGQFLTTLTAALGLVLILGQAGLLVFGTVPRSIPFVFPGMINYRGVNISVDKLVLMILSVCVTIILFLVYEKTSIGRAMRSVSISPEAASLQGINVKKICLIAVGIGAALAGFAGGIITPSYGIHPQMGQTIIITVLLMVMLGGMDSLLGGVAGGLVVGLVLSFGQYYIGGTVQIFLFLVIALVIYFRPAGLLGRNVELEM